MVMSFGKNSEFEKAEQVGLVPNYSLFDLSHCLISPSFKLIIWNVATMIRLAPRGSLLLESIEIILEKVLSGPRNSTRSLSGLSQQMALPKS